MTRVWQAAMRWSNNSRSPLSATLAMVSVLSQKQPTCVSSSAVPATNVLTSRAEFVSYRRTVLSAPACVARGSERRRGHLGAAWRAP